MSTFLREEEGPTWQQLLEEGKTCLSDAWCNGVGAGCVVSAGMRPLH